MKKIELGAKIKELEKEIAGLEKLNDMYVQIITGFCKLLSDEEKDEQVLSD